MGARKRIQGNTGHLSNLAKARALAKKHGVRFLPSEEVRQLPQAEISKRMGRAFSTEGDVGDDFEAAFLGVISEPDHKLSYIFEAFPPCVRQVVRCSTFLYFSGGRDRTMTWDIHRNVRTQC